VLDEIRALFARRPEARMRGYTPARFSFNARGGRCEACKGHGVQRIEMQFLPDAYAVCEVCDGRRFNRETLRIRYRGLTIAEVLDLTVTEASGIFANVPALDRLLTTLAEVGLGYLELKRPVSTLSSGEAQRLKLARELGRPSGGRTLYLLDEPTTGLHPVDVAKLLDILHRLVGEGHSVVVIEHNLDVIRAADWVIDLGPEGGEEGGHLLFAGPPADLPEVAASYTGRWLMR